MDDFGACGGADWNSSPFDYQLRLATDVRPLDLNVGHRGNDGLRPSLVRALDHGDGFSFSGGVPGPTFPLGDDDEMVDRILQQQQVQRGSPSTDDGEWRVIDLSSSPEENTSPYIAAEGERVRPARNRTQRLLPAIGTDTSAHALSNSTFNVPLPVSSSSFDGNDPLDRNVSQTLQALQQNNRRLLTQVSSFQSSSSGEGASSSLSGIQLSGLSASISPRWQRQLRNDLGRPLVSGPSGGHQAIGDGMLQRSPWIESGPAVVCVAEPTPVLRSALATTVGSSSSLRSQALQGSPPLISPTSPVGNLSVYAQKLQELEQVRKELETEQQLLLRIREQPFGSQSTPHHHQIGCNPTTQFSSDASPLMRSQNSQGQLPGACTRAHLGINSHTYDFKAFPEAASVPPRRTLPHCPVDFPETGSSGGGYSSAPSIPSHRVSNGPAVGLGSFQRVSKNNIVAQRLGGMRLFGAAPHSSWSQFDLQNAEGNGCLPSTSGSQFGGFSSSRTFPAPQERQRREADNTGSQRNEIGDHSRASSHIPSSRSVRRGQRRPQAPSKVIKNSEVASGDGKLTPNSILLHLMSVMHQLQEVLWSQINRTSQLEAQVQKLVHQFDGLSLVNGHDPTCVPRNGMGDEESSRTAGASAAVAFVAGSSEPAGRGRVAPSLMNNQVEPGSRVNNYWDAFRSSSFQQNPLTVSTSDRGTHDGASGGAGTWERIRDSRGGATSSGGGARPRRNVHRKNNLESPAARERKAGNQSSKTNVNLVTDDPRTSGAGGQLGVLERELRSLLSSCEGKEGLYLDFLRTFRRFQDLTSTPSVTPNDVAEEDLQSVRDNRSSSSGFCVSSQSTTACSVTPSALGAKPKNALGHLKGAEGGASFFSFDKSGSQRGEKNLERHRRFSMDGELRSREHNLTHHSENGLVSSQNVEGSAGEEEQARNRFQISANRTLPRNMVGAHDENPLSADRGQPLSDVQHVSEDLLLCPPQASCTSTESSLDVAGGTFAPSADGYKAQSSVDVDRSKRINTNKIPPCEECGGTIEAATDSDDDEDTEANVESRWNRSFTFSPQDYSGQQHPQLPVNFPLRLMTEDERDISHPRPFGLGSPPPRNQRNTQGFGVEADDVLVSRSVGAAGGGDLAEADQSQEMGQPEDGSRSGGLIEEDEAGAAFLSRSGNADGGTGETASR